MMTPYLPHELLAMIFPRLLEWKQTAVDSSPQIDRQGVETLASLCRSSKHFRSIAEPILYQAYSKRDSTTGDSDCTRRDLQLFLRTAIDRPDLAAKIKTLSLGPWTTKDGRTGARNFLPPQIDLASQLGNATKRFPFKRTRNDFDRWAPLLEKGDEDAEIALLMALLPNVETLHISFPSIDRWFDDDYFFRYLLSTEDKEMAYRPVTRSVSGIAKGNGFSYGLVTTKRVPQVLTNLRELNVMPRIQKSTTPESECLKLQPVRELFVLPSLERLSISSAYEKAHPISFENAIDDMSHIKHLKLTNCYLSSSAINTLTTQCRDLRSFALTWGPKTHRSSASRSDDTNEGNESTSDGQEVELNWPALRLALEPSRTTLESLILSLPDSTQQQQQQQPIPSTPESNSSNIIGTLHDFPRLQHLRIPEHGLFDTTSASTSSSPLSSQPPLSIQSLSSTLPSSLKILEISQLQHLLTSLPALAHPTSSLPISSLPDLETISVAYRDKSSTPLWSRQTGFAAPQSTEFHECLWLKAGQGEGDEFEEWEAKDVELEEWRARAWVERISFPVGLGA